MRPPTKEGPVGRGIRVTVQQRAAEFIPPDDDEPAAFTARVTVNGLLAGKATVHCQSWTSATDEDYAAAAISYAWAQATKRIEKWRTGVARWDAL